MNKKLLVSVFLIFFAFSFMLLSQEESEEKMKWEDERISITVDKIERVDSFPERMKSKSQDYTPLIESTRPIKGCDLVFIHITIVEKRDLRVQAMDLRMQRPKSPHLVDDQGKIYWTRTAQFKFTSSPKTGYLIFNMPKDVAIPVQLNYIYQYRDEPPEPQDIKFGQIDIDLTLIQ